MDDVRVGVVGLGGPGLELCRRAAAAGVPLRCYDPEHRHEALELDHAVVSGGARELAEASDIVVIALSGDEEVRSTALRGGGLLECAASGTVIVVLTAVLPATCRELAALASTRDIAVVDAPPTRASRAGEGEWHLLAGGEPTAIRRLQSLMDRLGVRLERVGDIGAGQRARLVEALTYWVGAAAFREAATLAEALDLDAARLTPMLRRSLAGSDDVSWDPQRYERDLQNIAAVASALDVDLLMATAARERLRASHLADQAAHRNGDAAVRSSDAAGRETGVGTAAPGSQVPEDAVPGWRWW